MPSEAAVMPRPGSMVDHIISQRRFSINALGHRCDSSEQPRTKEG